MHVVNYEELDGRHPSCGILTGGNHKEQHVSDEVCYRMLAEGALVKSLTLHLVDSTT